MSEETSEEIKVENNTNNPKPNGKDKLAFITSIVFLIALGVLGYRYFNSSSSLNLNPVEQQLTNIGNTISQSIEDTKDMLADTNEEEAGEISSTSTTRESEEKMTISNGTNSMIDTYWVANDYQAGDIKDGSYTVKSGDTLWEIAEAVYGNGAAWTNILNANSASIGYLANGQQALIFPGQMLTLPSIT